MNLVINDPATVQQLRAAQTSLNLTDAAGNVIGRFTPGDPVGAEPPIAEEELLLLEQQTGGRPLADILADLERKYGR
jgi:hypothetical protein